MNVLNSNQWKNFLGLGICVWNAKMFDENYVSSNQNHLEIHQVGKNSNFPTLESENVEFDRRKSIEGCQFNQLRWVKVEWRYLDEAANRRISLPSVRIEWNRILEWTDNNLNCPEIISILEDCIMKSGFYVLTRHIEEWRQLLCGEAIPNQCLNQRLSCRSWRNVSRSNIFK